MPKLLLDQNLSRRLVQILEPQFPGSSHVVFCDLHTADDSEIFQFARGNGFAILSKDVDFHHLSFRFGSPPKVIWAKLGNASTADIAGALLRQSLRIRRFLEDGDSALMVLER